jgi:phage terminase small subunit
MKLTVKQEAFCLAYIETGNASEAYRRSYSAEKMKQEVIAIEASRLLDNPNVTLRVAELQQSVVKRHEVTVDSLMLELEKARIAAMGATTPQSAAAVAATMGKAKLAGLLIDKIEAKVNNLSDVKDDELAAIATGRSR